MPTTKSRGSWYSADWSFNPLTLISFPRTVPTICACAIIFDHFISQNIYRERQEIVVLSNVLSDPVNAYSSDFRYDIVDKINDQKIQRIDDVAEALKKPSDYYVIEMVGNGRPLVLERKAVEEASERIRSALSGHHRRKPSKMKIPAVCLLLILASRGRSRKRLSGRERAGDGRPSCQQRLARPRQFHESGFRFLPPLDERGAISSPRAGCRADGRPGPGHG